MKTCLIPECCNKYYAKGFCKSHYIRKRKGENPFVTVKIKCESCSCSILRKNNRENLCSPCYLKCYHELFPKKSQRYKNNGGLKWGYKDYRKLKALKKDKCELCGLPGILHIHHKDLNIRNSLLNNIVIVCVKCHHDVFHRNKNSKYRRAYGMTTTEISDLLDISLCMVNKLHRKGFLEKYLNMVKKRLDK